MWSLMIFGVLVHLLLLYSVFDIYFISPVYHGMTPHKSGGSPPAKRVVLFVADGLRAASFYHDDTRKHVPYLSSIVDKTGAWGVSHTQVPTESRPGHVAILAGFNEDPSAITRGWKTNPVDFDSVINQSTNAWCWGSPDIVDIFNRDNLPHIHLKSYDAYMQDFSGKNGSTTLLDKWVFDEVVEFLNEREKDECADFCADGNVIFLHLLGLDTAGHTFKPESREYLENIVAVDRGVELMVKRLDAHFGDDRTSYVFTADHGMTNWGSHGDGSEHETRVPFVAWGAGIRRDSGKQLDIEQSSIAVLIASLIGINVPINSIGTVPLDIIDASNRQKARILYANARQLLEQFLMKHKNLESGTNSLIFKPFPKLSTRSLRAYIEKLDYSVETGSAETAVQECYELIELCKEGLRYYDGYYQNLLLAFVTSGFVAWIVYLFISINGEQNLKNDLQTIIASTSTSKCLGAVTFALFLIILAQTLPIKYYLYCAFPATTWFAVIRSYKNSWLAYYRIERNDLLMVCGYLIAVELLFLTFFYRSCLCLIFVYIFIESLNERELHENSVEWIVWIATTILLGLCPLMLQLQIQFGYFSTILGWSLWMIFSRKILSKQLSRRDRLVLTGQFAMLTVAFVNNICVQLTISSGLGLLFVNKAVSWILLVLSPIAPLLILNSLQYKVASAIIALAVPYTLMAVGYEHLFMCLFAQFALKWFTVEFARKFKKDLLPFCNITKVFVTKNAVDRQCARHCLYLLIFVMLGYFGAGNTGSMSSFDPMWVRCFVTVFSPFTMAILIGIKLVIPFLIVLCAFRGVMFFAAPSLHNCFLIILLFCDLMVVQFLYCVKNEGSWLEIGVSLSRFIAANVTTIILIMFYQIANILTVTNGDYFLSFLPSKLVNCIRKYDVYD